MLAHTFTALTDKYGVRCRFRGSEWRPTFAGSKLTAFSTPHNSGAKVRKIFETPIIKEVKSEHAR